MTNVGETSVPPTTGPLSTHLAHATLVLEHLVDHGPSTRSELTTATGLGRGAIAGLTARLLDAGVIRPAGADPTGGGRATPLSLSPADPGLVTVAPRVLGLERGRPNWITRYEDARSSLDLGEDSSSVRPRSPVTWVSSTCLVARVDALGRGFDESMRVGEDVDLVWRLVDEGRRVRFEPAASVRHEHRSTLLAWMGRKAFYGTGAHPLAVRHPDDIAPVVLAPWGAGFLVALMAQRRWSLPVAAAIAGVTIVRIGRRAVGVRHPYRLAGRLTGYGAIAALTQGFALLLRHWWPLAAIGCLVSRRVRRAVLVATLADTVIEYARTKPRLDPVRFAVARRLDDAAYGAGVWWSAIRARSPKALLPDLRRRH